MTYAKIAGTGSYLPTKVLTNAELASLVDTSDEWIKQRVGIESRHIASAEETTVFMSTKAAEQALERAQVNAKDIELIMVATSTPDDLMPNTAVQVQAAIGAGLCMSFDVAAACSGFITALSIAEKFFQSGSVKTAVVIGAERMSRVTNWQDRSTCVLFGDGSGAVVLKADAEVGILGSSIHGDGNYRDLLFIPNSLPCTAMSDDSPKAHLEMEGRSVFKQAVNMLGDAAEEMLLKHALTKNDIDWLVPHQANKRIIDATAKKLQMTTDKIVLTLAQHGNTSAASVALALDVAVADGRIKRGDVLLLEAFGAGFVWGAVLVKF